MIEVNEQMLTQIVTTVQKAAREQIIPKFRRLDRDDISQKSSSVDLVTIADRAAEQAMTDDFKRDFPHWNVIGEEATANNPGLLQQLKDDVTTVIIDPIDGTWNYAHGLSMFGVILAVVHAGETVLGLLYDPIHDDWVYAIKGQGAFYVTAQGQQQLQLTGSRTAEQLFGFVPAHNYHKATQEMLFTQFSSFARVTQLGCSCHEYRALSMGHYDFCLSTALMPWDHAAGELIYREAGGWTGLLDGSPYTPMLTQGNLLVAPSQQSWRYIRDKLAPAFGL